MPRSHPAHNQPTLDTDSPYPWSAASVYQTLTHEHGNVTPRRDEILGAKKKKKRISKSDNTRDKSMRVPGIGVHNTEGPTSFSSNQNSLYGMSINIHRKYTTTIEKRYY